jgi:asparagine N-glycosylation enzyme membrane subunit Stt3
VRRAFALLGILAALWTIVVWLSHGFELAVGPLRVSSTNPARPLVITLVAALGYLAAAGRARAREDAAHLRRGLTPARLAAALAIAILVIGIANNSWGAGASDSYSYVSQMDLLRAGTLKTRITIARDVPWPNALATFTPFGYAAVAGESAIAPITGAGLPLLMAAFKTIGGQTAAFIVVPLTGALLVWTTFLIGRQVHSDAIGLAAAWLVATSPTFLMMFKTLMSDVPAARRLAAATVHASEALA